MQQSCAHTREECNKYDLIDAPCFGLVKHNDWSRWFTMSSAYPHICSPPFSFEVGFAENQITKLECEKHFRRVTYYALVGNALSSFQWMVNNWVQDHRIPRFGNAPLLGP